MLGMPPVTGRIVRRDHSRGQEFVEAIDLCVKSQVWCRKKVERGETIDKGNEAKHQIQTGVPALFLRNPETNDSQSN